MLLHCLEALVKLHAPVIPAACEEAFASLRPEIKACFMPAGVDVPAPPVARTGDAAASAAPSVFMTGWVDLSEPASTSPSSKTTSPDPSDAVSQASEALLKAVRPHVNKALELCRGGLTGTLDGRTFTTHKIGNPLEAAVELDLYFAPPVTTPARPSPSTDPLTASAAAGAASSTAADLSTAVSAAFGGDLSHALTVMMVSELSVRRHASSSTGLPALPVDRLVVPVALTAGPTEGASPSQGATTVQLLAPLSSAQDRDKNGACVDCDVVLDTELSLPAVSVLVPQDRGTLRLRVLARRTAGCKCPRCWKFSRADDDAATSLAPGTILPSGLPAVRTYAGAGVLSAEFGGRAYFPVASPESVAALRKCATGAIGDGLRELEESARLCQRCVDVLADMSED